MTSSGSSTFFRTVRHSIRAGAWNTYPYCRSRRASSAVRPAMSSSPPVGCSRSAIRRSRVVFPQPLGPIRLMNSPFWMLRLASFSATVSPPGTGKTFCRSRMDTMGGSFGGGLVCAGLACGVGLVYVTVPP